MQPPILPSWFKHRQCKAEPAGGDDVLRLTGPNLGEAYVRIHRLDNGRWQAALRLQQGGPDVATSEGELESAQDAWQAAFELYRTHLIV
jgi:hypothetical protein